MLWRRLKTVPATASCPCIADRREVRYGNAGAATS